MSRPRRDVLTTRRYGHMLDGRSPDSIKYMNADTTRQRRHPTQTDFTASHCQSGCAATRPAPRVRTYVHRHRSRVFFLTFDARPTAWGPRLHASAATARPTTPSSIRPITRAGHPKPLQSSQPEVTRILRSHLPLKKMTTERFELPTF